MPDGSAGSRLGHALDVLIVEDDPRTCELLAEVCRRRGMTVATAADGRAAVTAVTREPGRFSLVITDLYLPGVDGFEVLRSVRAANPSCYVVMVTGYATIDSAVRAVREGAYDYLPKPFALGQIDVILGRVQDRIALEQENRRLARQVSGVQKVGTPFDRIADPLGDVGERLFAIEARLAAIERLLRDRAGE